MTGSAPAKPVRIQALARASAIIDVIANGDEAGVGLTAISKATSLNKTTAFNLLASLVALRLVEQDAQTRKYRLGLRCLELGRQVQQRLQVSHVARPVLVALCRKTNETVNLGIPGMLDFRVIDSFVGSRVSHGRANNDWRWMYHCTALGKAFLAGWDAQMRKSIYDSSELTRLTPNTMTDLDALEAQLAGFRARGYATDTRRIRNRRQRGGKLDRRRAGRSRRRHQRQRAFEPADGSGDASHRTRCRPGCQRDLRGPGRRGAAPGSAGRGAGVKGRCPPKCGHRCNTRRHCPLFSRWDPAVPGLRSADLYGGVAAPHGYAAGKRSISIASR